MKQYFRPVIEAEPTADASIRLFEGPLFVSRVLQIKRDAAGNVSQSVIPVGDAPGDKISYWQARSGEAWDQPQLMGVLNVTPDSFSDGGKFNDPQRAVAHAQAMIAEGVDVLDIGGESTRPGAKEVSEDEEIARTAPVIAAIRVAGIMTSISIDTRKARVAKAALDAGANMINDVSALQFDPDMAGLAASAGCPICLMHAQGLPETMQNDPRYDQVVLDVYDYLEARIDHAIAQGIERKNIIIDPGVGFGKSVAHNLSLIRNIAIFHSLGCPVLLGVSRKSFIGKISGQEIAGRRVAGSVAMALEGVRQGVQIIRAHDIEAHRQAFALWGALQEQL